MRLVSIAENILEVFQFTCVVDESIKSPILGLDIFKRRGNRCIIFNVNLNCVEMAGGKVVLEALDGLVSLFDGPPSDQDLILFIRAANSLDNLETKTGVGACHKHELSSIHFARGLVL